MSAYDAYRPESSSTEAWHGQTRGGRPPPPRVNAVRLWSGGVATAVVAAGVTVVAFLVVRGLFDIPVLGADLDGGVMAPSMLAYAAWAALAALILTGVMHLLLLTGLPRPGVFFGWIGAIVVAIAVIAPLTLSAPLDERLATATVNLVLGAVIVGLVSVSATASVRGRSEFTR